MEKKRMMTAIKMYERNLPIAKIMLEQAGVRKEVAESLGVFKYLPDNWDMAYRACLADNEK